jgi:hypothetical protein
LSADSIPSLLESVPERRPESLAIKRLEQVIDGVDFEGSQRELVVCGDKHDHRHGLTANGLQNAESIQFRHLDIQKDQVGQRLLDHGDRFTTVRALANEFDVGFGFQQLPQPVAGERFVINDQRSNLHDG